MSGGLALVSFAALLVLERRRPLRRPTRPKARRDLRNLAVAALSAATIRTCEAPLVKPLAGLVHRRRWGLLTRLSLPAWLEVGLGVVLLDYTLWVWHVLTHRAPPLWRLHQVHHADLDMDASTALRFHFLEMLASVPWRAGQVLLVGAAPLTLSVWQTLTLVAILFHHSNVRLPLELERRLAPLIMTPRLHGIHHSVRPEERDSNWGTIFTWPDRLHGTALADLERPVTIGVESPRAPERLTFGQLLALPLSGNGSHPYPQGSPSGVA